MHRLLILLSISLFAIYANGISVTILTDNNREFHGIMYGNNPSTKYNDFLGNSWSFQLSNGDSLVSDFVLDDRMIDIRGVHHYSPAGPGFTNHAMRTFSFFPIAPGETMDTGFLDTYANSPSSVRYIFSRYSEPLDGHAWRLEVIALDKSVSVPEPFPTSFLAFPVGLLLVFRHFLKLRSTDSPARRGR